MPVAIPAPTVPVALSPIEVWRAQLLAIMAKTGPGEEAVRHITEKGVYIDFRPLDDAGAMYLPWWWPSEGFPRPKVYFNASIYSVQTPPDDPFMVTLGIHEDFHLRQGVIRALSIQGELEAWQAQYQAYEALAGYKLGWDEEERILTPYGEQWARLAQLSPDSREDLALAQTLMAEISSGYKSPCLPLYPAPAEILYQFGQGKTITEVWNLIQEKVHCAFGK